jgi:SAM-dependent methyltransferase
MHAAVMEFVRRNLGPDDVAGREVLEVGSYDVNGSVRSLVGAWGPARYLGVDIAPGPGVDAVCPVEQIVARYGACRFDLVVCTEMLEHVRDWRTAVWNLKQVVREGGILLLTTRSPGFWYHGYPHDYWRFELDDMRAIFQDCTLEALIADPESPGVMVRARKPRGFAPRDLGAIALYSIASGRRTLQSSRLHEAKARLYWGARGYLRTALPGGLRLALKRLLGERTE